LGIDVGVRKGLDLVLLDESLVPRATHRGVSLAGLGDLLEDSRADVVAVDGPPAWAAQGRSRKAERDLLRLRIRSYATPTAGRGTRHPFYAWMRTAIDVFDVALRRGYPLARTSMARGHAIEAFAHASAVVLAGALPPPGTLKTHWRRGILGTAGVSVEALRTPDQIDAALAALTGMAALRGRTVVVGDPGEGLIVLPTAVMPTTPYARGAA
jgi:predicted nuclease with RNAse H fold